MALNLPVIVGSVRSGRMGLRVGRYCSASLSARGHASPLVDPVEHPLPLLDKMHKEYEAGKAPEPLEKLAQIFREADGFVIACAEYNHSVPPALSNLLAHFQREYFFKPSAIVCYSVGPFGGVRAAMQLRAMLPELGTSSIPSILAMPKVQELLGEDGTPTGDRLAKSAARFFDEFEWYAKALQAARNQGTPY